MIDELRTALALRYRIERELGAGGMATVSWRAAALAAAALVFLQPLSPQP